MSSPRGTGRLVPVRLAAPEAAGVIRAAWDTGDAVLVLDPRAPRPEVDGILARMRPELGVEPEVAAVVVTSGTAGAPKGVELTWDGLAASGAAVAAALGIEPGDRWLACLPLHYVAGLAVLGRAGITGTPVTVIERFDVSAVAGADATLVSLVPTMVRRLREAGVDIDRFRRILLGGGPVHETGPNMVATYGLTETWGGVVHDGHPLDGVELSVGDGQEILVRGPMVMRGYRLAPEETAAAFTADGWLRTGDAGSIDSGGRLRVTDRLRDLIVTGEVKVSPSEVEAVLAQHPQVADVCVVGAVDPEWGQRVVAYVVARDPAAPPRLADVRAFAADHLSPAKLPRELVATDAIPRTAGGKPLRRLLYRDSTGGRPAPAPSARPCPSCGAEAGLILGGYCGVCGTKQPAARDHTESVHERVAAVSDRGRTHHRNEDAFALHADAGFPIVAVVCDGVSSTVNPDVASQAAADAAVATLVAAGGGDLAARIIASHGAAQAAVEGVEGEPLPPDLGWPSCTFLAGVVEEGGVTLGTMGDCRAFWVPTEGPAQTLTEDDSWAAELVASGGLTPEEASAHPMSHTINRWLGRDADPAWRPRVSRFDFPGAGRLVLVSDGLWNYAPTGADVAAAADTGSPAEVARRLVDFANQRGGHDNITVVVIDVDP